MANVLSAYNEWPTVIFVVVVVVAADTERIFYYRIYMKYIMSRVARIKITVGMF
jgi:hypothetical protein